MFKKCTIFTLAAVITALVLQAPVSAAMDGQVIQGKGELWAKGVGLIHLEGKDLVSLEGYGKGILVIKNDASKSDRCREVVTALSFASRPSWLGDKSCPVRNAVRRSNVRSDDRSPIRLSSRTSLSR